MKSKIITCSMVVALSAIFITSCQKEDIKNEGSILPSVSKTASKLPAVDIIEKNSELDKIAKQLASSLREKEMRTFVKNEANKMFDGDYDILYKDVRNVMISGKTLENRIVSDIKTSALSLNEVKEISDEMPQLNISVPYNINKWDTESYTPLVAVVPVDYDDKTAVEVKAYDADGNIHWLDANKAPNFPVVVVGTNERTKVENNGKVVLTHPGKSNNGIHTNTVELEEIGDNPGGDGGGPNPGGNGGGGGGCSSSRYDGNWEYLYGITFPGTSLDDRYEDWVLGAPEIRLSVFKPTENFTKLGEFLVFNYEPSRRANVNEGHWEYYGLNWNLFQWYPADYGDIVLYKMIEEDAGDIMYLTVGGEFKIPFTSQKVNLSTKIKIQNRDDEGPTTPVDFRDTRCEKIYGDASFRFHIKHQ